MKTKTYTIRDPFTGTIEVEGRTPEEAIAEAYADIPVEERPEHVWCNGEKHLVPDGRCSPVQ